MATKTKRTNDFSELPILPVRETVLFPNAILPITPPSSCNLPSPSAGRIPCG